MPRQNDLNQKSSTGIFFIIIGALVLFIIFIIVGSRSGWFYGNRNQISQKILLQKYTFCESISLQMFSLQDRNVTTTDKKVALDKKFKGKLSRKEKKEHSDLLIELASIKKQHDSLAIIYRDSMAAVNWRFINPEGLPEKIIRPLPKEIPLEKDKSDGVRTTSGGQVLIF